MAQRKPAYDDGDGPDSEGPSDIDTRDIFEKALDNAPAIGALAGGAILGRSMRKGMRSSEQEMRAALSPEEWAQYLRGKQRNPHLQGRATALTSGVGAAAGGALGGMASGIAKRESNRKTKK